MPILRQPITECAVHKSASLAQECVQRSLLVVEGLFHEEKAAIAQNPRRAIFKLWGGHKLCSS